VTTTHAHPLETDAVAVLDYADLRAVAAPGGRLNVRIGG